MTPTSGPKSPADPSISIAAENLGSPVVWGSAVLTAIAAGLALHFQAGAGIGSAVLLGIGLFILLGMIHVLMVKSHDIARLNATLTNLQLEMVRVRQQLAHVSSALAPPNLAATAAIAAVSHAQRAGAPVAGSGQGEPGHAVKDRPVASIPVEPLAQAPARRPRSTRPAGEPSDIVAPAPANAVFKPAIAVEHVAPQAAVSDATVAATAPATGGFGSTSANTPRHLDTFTADLAADLAGQSQPRAPLRHSEDRQAKPNPNSQSSRNPVADALAGGRLEIFLQPIVALDGMATVSYEAFPRLRDDKNALIPADQHMAALADPAVNHAIGRQTVLSTIAVMEQLEARGKSNPVFVNVAPALLADAAFFREFIDTMKGRRSIGNLLVLEMAQSHVRALDQGELESLDSLARLGFTLSMDGVRDIDMDFEPLIARGLAFVKLSASQFVEGLPAGSTALPTNEIRGVFEDAGLQVIVDAITDEATLDAVLKEGISFGQGPLFAEPRPLKASMAEEPSQAA